MTNKGRTPDTDELSLWQKVVKGVAPWRDVEPSPHPARQNPPIKKTASPPVKTSPSSTSRGQKTLDRQTDEKLVKGKMPIEATLDLHGMTQNQAQETLNGFLMRSYNAGKRCVLVITGKGSRNEYDDGIVSERREKGVLKSRLPDWLAMPPLDAITLKHTQATQKHGGGGAFYIYLKNNKK